jgi:hypothetical protein
MRLRIRVLPRHCKKALPVPPKKREAERRKAHHGFRPAAEEESLPANAASTIASSRERCGIEAAAPSPFGAPPRPCAEGFIPRLGSGPRFLESPDPSGRTLSGTSAASTWQSGHAPDGRCPKPPGRGLQARLREPHPPHRSAVTGRRPFDGRALIRQDVTEMGTDVKNYLIIRDNAAAGASTHAVRGPVQETQRPEVLTQPALASTARHQ